MSERLHALGSVTRIVWCVASAAQPVQVDDALIARQQYGVIQGLKLIQAVLQAGWDREALHWTVITTQAVKTGRADAIDPAPASVHGLLGCLQKEQPGWRVALFDLPAGVPPQATDCLDLAGLPGAVLAWRDGRWLQRRFTPQRRSEAVLAARPGEVQVVIGGAGGVGRAWSEAMLRKHPVQLVWIGRRDEDEALRTRLDALAAIGPRPLYIRADATRLEELQAARDRILQAFGRVDVLVHAAMQPHDAAIAGVGIDGFQAGLMAKVATSVRMAQAFGGVQPKAVVFFASVASFVGPPGASAYASGCCFTDALAAHLSATWSARVRVANWGFFGEVGAVASEQHRQRMARAGFASIDVDDAMLALNQLLCGDSLQMAYLRTTGAHGLQGMSLGVPGGSPVEAAPAAPGGGRVQRIDDVRRALGLGREPALAAMLAYLRSLVVEVLGVEASHFAAAGRRFEATLLAEFGMDSLSATTVRNLIRHELQAEVGAQQIIGERASELAESIYRQLLLRQVSVAPAEASEADTESFVF